jgi:hypothetical protein
MNMANAHKGGKTFFSRLIFSLLIMMITFIAGLPLDAQAVEWPREILAPEGKIIVYQPQLETFKDNKLTARAAVSLTKKDETEPIFGVVWFSARVSTDRNARTIQILDVDVTDVKAHHEPDPAKLERFSQILENTFSNWDEEISLDKVLTMLDLVEKEKVAAKDLKTTPPRIIFVTHPAVLVTIDGEPDISKVDNSNLMRIVNTAYFIVFDPTAKTYFLKGGQEWFTAGDIMGPWQTGKKPPASVIALATEASDTGQRGQEAEQPLAGRMPQIIVTTTPAELIISEGEPKYQSISGTELLSMSNTKSDVFMEIGSQKYFLLLSGRWFIGSSLNGPWSYVASDKLPNDFKKIPPGSAKARVLASVAGTEEAKEAVHDTYIPQTATIKRGEEKIDVEYDGEPKFEEIEDTDMYYGVNTPSSVILVNKKYYLCHDAVWYSAYSPYGPWIVSVSVPQVIYTIPPSYPVYPVRYVYVYDYTPEVVYIGYTSGYVGGYVYGGTVIYGTGYYYRPWYRSVYYARPVTYGVAVRYNSYTGGWGVRVGYGGPVGWVGVGRVGWAGGASWRYGYRPNDLDITRSITTPRGTLTSSTDFDFDYGDIDIEQSVKFEPNENVYERREEVNKRREEKGGSREERRADRETKRGESGTRSERADTRRETKPADRRAEGTRKFEVRGESGTPSRQEQTYSRGMRSDKPNNVFSDRDGNVYRRNESGWQQRDQSGWSSPDTRTRASRDRSSYQRNRSSLDRNYSARQRGAQRSSSFKSYSGSRSGRSGSISRGGGGRSGGRGGGGGVPEQEKI